MRDILLRASLCLMAAGAGLGFGPSQAQDLVWQVENPFRFYKNADAFKAHESAFRAVQNPASSQIPSDIVQRIERCLNDPTSIDPAMRAACLAIAPENAEQRRLGWAAAALDEVCYDRDQRPRRHPSSCKRDYSWNNGVEEDYILPRAHTVSVRLVPQRLAEVGNRLCVWTWKPRASGAESHRVERPCQQELVVDRVPFSLDRAASGVSVEVALPDGRKFAEPNVVVDDLLIVGLGDSFASGEGNPDHPVRFSPIRRIDYRTPRVASLPAGSQRKAASLFSKAAASLNYDPYILPRRWLPQADEPDIYSDEYLDAFFKQSAKWLSPECHRSQYAFPFRVSLQLALEDRHRAITLVHLACSGAEVIEGMFQRMKAREHYDASRNKTKDVLPQFDELTQIMCKVSARVDGPRYALEAFESGSTQPRALTVSPRWCPPGQRKREIDLVLLSIGGNDVGFSQLAAYAFLDRVTDIAPLVGLASGRLRFGTNVANRYLASLPARLMAVRGALQAGFGVFPAKVVQASYERVEYDEGQRLCGATPREALGMDVHSKFKFDRARLTEVSGFITRLLDHMVCISKGDRCPQNLRNSPRTEFRLVVGHQPEFLRRGICARDPQQIEADGRLMAMPRVLIGHTDGDFTPYSPASYMPYVQRWRLIRTPNDAFLTANEHMGGQTPLYDILQPAIAGLFSGAFHPTAQAHAIVADYVTKEAREVLRERR